MNLAVEVLAFDAEVAQVAQHGQRDVLGMKEFLAMSRICSAVTASIFSIISSSVKKRLKCNSCRARLLMRLEVDSRPSMNDPLRLSLARRSSSAGTRFSLISRSSFTME